MHLSRSKITIFFLLIFVALIGQAWALPSLTLSGNTQTFYEGESERFVDSGVTVTGLASDVIDGARIIILDNFVTSDDRLISTVTPAGITASFDNAKGILSIDGAGNISTYQSILRGVKYKSLDPNITGATVKNITMSLGKLLAFKGPDHSTYHYYEVVSPAGGYNWTEARDAAAASTHFGLQGYLATITSAGENTFASDKFNESIWIGASDVGVEGTWNWVTGPEAGNTFWQGKGSGVSVGGYYENWYNTSEPNDWGTGEDYAHFWAGKNGQWNDFPHKNKLKYMVEYGGMPGDPAINLVDSVATTVQENRAPTNITLQTNDFLSLPVTNWQISEEINPPTSSVKLSVVDPDNQAGNPNQQQHTIAFVSSGSYPDNNKFLLTGDPTNGYVLTANAVFDYETQANLHLRLSATETTGEKLTYNHDLTIPIINVADKPVIVTALSNTTINEDQGLQSQTFVIKDDDTALSSLTLTATSTNAALLSASNISISGTGNTRTLNYTTSANAFGSTDIMVNVEDGTFTGVNGANTIMTLTVNAVNDAPTHSSVSDISLVEDQSHTFTGAQALSVRDEDIGAASLQVSLSVSMGSLSLSGTAGLTFTTGDGTADASMVFTGTQTAVNTALNNLVYQPTANSFGNDTLFWQTSDQGQSGSGGTKTVTSLIGITVSSVNDAPVLHASGNLDLSNMNEDDAAGSGNSWQSLLDAASWTVWQDNDAASTPAFAIVGSDNQSIGSWQTSTNGGSTWSTLPTTSLSSSLLFQASSLIRFVPNADAFGQANLIIKAWDGSDGSSPGSTINTTTHTASSAWSSNTILVQQTVNSINDAPIWTMPATVSTAEDVVATIGSMVLNDVDLGTNNASVNIFTYNGKLTLAGTTGLTFTTGDGTSDNNMVFTGTLSNINTALLSSSFTPDLNFNGTGLIQISGNDLGQAGAGGALESTAFSLVMIAAQNDAPTLDLNISLSSPQQLEDINTSGNRVSTLLTNLVTAQTAYDDVDRRIPTTLPLPDGMAISSWATPLGQWQVSFNGGGAWSNFPTDTGSSYLLRDDSNTRLRFLSHANQYGSTNILVRAWDMTAGISGNLQTVSTPGAATSPYSGNQSRLSVTISPVNDAPVITTPAFAVTTLEDTAMAFSSNTITLYDVESSGNSINLSLNLAAAQGNLSFGTPSGWTSTGSATNTTLTGNIQDLNQALLSMVYTPHLNVSGTSAIEIKLNDNDTTASTPLTTSTNVVVQVSPVNDAPLLSTLPSGLNYTENVNLSPFASSTITISDVDSTHLKSLSVIISGNALAEDLLSVTLGATSISANYNVSTGNLSLTGVDTIANYQTVLNTLVFQHNSENPDREGTEKTRSLSFTVSDGWAQSSSSTTMSITAINDAPIISSWDNTPSFIEGDLKTVLDANMSVSDGDNSLWNSATVVMTPFITGDALSVTTTGNISTSFASGTLSLSGSGTPAQYAQVLQSLAYSSSSEDPDVLGANPSRNINLQLSDGAASVNSSITLSVLSSNDRPSISTPISYSGNEDTSINLSSSSFFVSDVDDAGRDMSLRLWAGQGNLSLTATAGLTLTAGQFTGGNTMTVRGTKSAINTALSTGLQYIGNANFFGFDSLGIAIDDLGNSGNGGALVQTSSVSIDVAAVNDAPTFDVTSFNLPAIEEDDTNSAGNSVTYLVTNSANVVQISDVDPGSSYGLAIVGNPSSSSGQWQVSINQGGSWQNLGTVSDTSATVLDADGYLRFVPNVDFTGTANLIVRAWDRTSGEINGSSAVNLGTLTGTSAFSSQTATLSIVVGAVNDAPSLTVPPMQQLLEDGSLNIQGIVIGDTDLSATDMISLNLNVDRGTLRFGNDAPIAVLTITDNVSNINQKLASELIYQGLPNDNGFVNLDISVSDLGQHGLGGTKISTDRVMLNINEVNDAPTTASSSWSSNIAMLEDDTNHSGWSPAQWALNTAPVADVDLAAGTNIWKSLGVAITSMGNEVSGQWQMSLNAGGTWTAAPNISAGNALHLSLQGEHLIRFVPDANANGNLNLKFRAWDRTVAVPGQEALIAGTGGTFAYSSVEHSLIWEVVPVNDPPTILTNTQAQLAIEDNDYIFSLSRPNGIRLQDVDLVNLDNATLQFSLSTTNANIHLPRTTGLSFLAGAQGTSSMRYSGNISDLQSSLDGLILRPFLNFNGSDNLILTLHDLGLVGGREYVHELYLSMVYRSVNDAPLLSNLDGDVNTFTEGDLFQALDTGTALSISDVDSAHFNNGRLSVASISQGTRNDRLTLLDDTDLQFSGGNITYQSNIIGTYSDDSNDQAALTILFTSNNVTPAVAQAIYGNIRFSNSSLNPTSGTRLFRTVLRDGQGGAALASTRMRLRPVNNDPTFSTNLSTSMVYTEDQGAWQIFSSNLQLSDPDSADFSGGEFSLEMTGGRQSEDTWSFTNSGNFTLSNNTVLYLGQSFANVTSMNVGDTIFKAQFSSNASSTNNILEMLSCITYTNLSQKPIPDTRSFTMFVSDGDGGLSSSLSFAFGTVAVNDAPVMSDGATLALPSILEDSTNLPGWTMQELIALEANLISDVDLLPVYGLGVELLSSNTQDGVWEYRLANGTWQSLSHLATGTLLLSSNDRVRFTPSANYFGSIDPALRIHAWDQSSGNPGQRVATTPNGGTTSLSTVNRNLSLVVTNIPDPPVSVDGSFQSPQYTQRALLWTELDPLFSDVDRDTLQAIIVESLPSSGNLWLSGNLVTVGQEISRAQAQELLYVPHGGFSGTDSFIWRAKDSVQASEGTSTLTLNILPVTLNISLSQASISEAGEKVQLNITLANASTANVTCQLSLVQESLLNYKDIVMMDIGTVSIPAGNTTWQRDILIVDDIDVESTETVSFQLSAASFADIGTGLVQLSVEDNDALTNGAETSSPHIIVEWLDPAWVRESGTSSRVSLRLSQAPSGTVTVEPRSSDLGEGVLSVDSLSFNASNWNTTQIFTVTGVADNEIDGNVESAILFYSSDAQWNADTTSFVTIDQDSQGLVMIEAAPLVTSEAGAQTMLLFTLQQMPNDGMSLSPIWENSEHQPNPASLSFNAQNWNLPHVMIIKGLDNSVIEGDRFVDFTWQNSVSADPLLNNLKPRALEILHKDDDAMNANGSINLPPYKLVLSSDQKSIPAPARVMITYRSDDPELVSGLEGGIVDYDVVMQSRSGFQHFQATQATTFAKTFREAGVYKMELRAMDLLGAISLKTMTIVVQASGSNPISATSSSLRATAPYTNTWEWEKLTSAQQRSNIKLIEFDFDDDGHVDLHGYPSDARIRSVSHRYDRAGPHRASMRVLTQSGEVFRLTQKFQLSAPAQSLPSLNLSLTPSSSTVPSTLNIVGNWVGASESVQNVLWSFGDEAEIQWSHSSSSLSTEHVFNKPGTYTIQALVSLNDGRQVRSSKKIHFKAPVPRTLVWSGMMAKRLQSSELAQGFPLQVQAWPPQAQYSQLQTSIAGHGSFSSLDGLRHPTSESLDLTNVAQVSFNGSTSSSQLQIRAPFSATKTSSSAPFASSSSMSLPWNHNNSSYVEVKDGSSLHAPQLSGIVSSNVISLVLLGDSRLTMRDAPPKLVNIQRDVEFQLRTTTALEQPQKGIVLELAYDDIDQDGLLDQHQVSEHDIVPLRFDKALNRWVHVEYFMVHPVDNVVRVKSAHLSTFGLFIAGELEINPENSSGGGCLLE